MRKVPAILKNIRQFRRVSGLTPRDDHFSRWVQKPWSKTVIEVGCGVGMHPIQWAQQNPFSAMIAIERTKTKFNSFIGRLKNHALDNIYPVNKDALYWLPEHIPENSIDEFYFLYPNPYPKERQANKRWHRNPLFEFCLTGLKNQGLIHIASNELFYIEECKDYCKNFWKLDLVKEAQIHRLKDFQARTHFEKKYLKTDQACYSLVFKKNL